MKRTLAALLVLGASACGLEPSLATQFSVSQTTYSDHLLEHLDAACTEVAHEDLSYNTRVGPHQGASGPEIDAQRSADPNYNPFVRRFDDVPGWYQWSLVNLSENFDQEGKRLPTDDHGAELDGDPKLDSTVPDVAPAVNSAYTVVADDGTSYRGDGYHVYIAGVAAAAEAPVVAPDVDAAASKNAHKTTAMVLYADAHTIVLKYDEVDSITDGLAVQLTGMCVNDGLVRDYRSAAEAGMRILLQPGTRLGVAAAGMDNKEAEVLAIVRADGWYNNPMYRPNWWSDALRCGGSLEWTTQPLLHCPGLPPEPDTPDADRPF